MQKSKVWGSLVMGVLVLFLMVGVTQASSEFGEMLYGAKWAKGVKQLSWGNAGTIGGDPSIHLVLNSFEDATGIKINVIEISGSQVPEYTRAMTLKESTFDTMWLAGTRFFPDFPKLGWTIPLDDMVPPSLKEKWAPNAVEAFTYNGKLMAIPHLNTVRIFLYRKDLLEKAGFAQAPKDWNELVTVAKKLTVDSDGDGSIDRYGYVYSAGIGESCLETYSSFLYVAGGKLWNPDGTPAFNSPEGLAALKFMVDLVYKYKVTPPEVVTYREGNLGDLFLAGGAAMIEFDTCADVTQAINTFGKDSVGGAAPPKKPGVQNVRYFAKPIGVCVSASSKHKEAAKHLALVFGSWDTAWFTGCVEGDSSAYLPIYDNWYFKKHFPFAKATQYMQQRGITETHSYYSIIEEVFRKGIQSAIRRTRTPQEALDWLVSELKNEDVF